MMHLRRVMPIGWAVFFFFSVNFSASAQSSGQNTGPRQFGLGHPKTEHELPNGKLKRDLQQLPPKARGKALGWLQKFEFPIEDVSSLNVNPEGDIFYADTFVPEQSDTPPGAIEAATLNLTEADVFSLHSKPGSRNIVYLDFDGHIVEGTAWSSSTLVALPFDPSNNDSPSTVANFTADELGRIHEIWHRMSEDFAAFDIDVTTEEPATFTATTGRVLFTRNIDANGRSMPSGNAGGVAYVSVFGTSTYVSRYSPAFVYYNNLSSSTPGVRSYNGEAGSHEFGHNLGLSHDGTTSGTTYYTGHGNGLVSWAPIMGNSYYNNVTQWSEGDYPYANNTQDDIAVIASRLGYSEDDHGDSAVQSTPIRIEQSGTILVSSPETDPHNLLPENKGIIEDRADTDWFHLDLTDRASLILIATPSWHSFTVNEKRGSNLDIELSLLDSDLNVIALSDPVDDTAASVSANLNPGRYYVLVDGVNNYLESSYSDYASIGMYFLEGSIEASEPDLVKDTSPPTPETMAWAVAPHATGTNSIEMTAINATDDSGTVEYQFSCVAGGTGCNDSSWQSSPVYAANGLDPGTYYAFKVTARDLHGNRNSGSATMGDTTESIPLREENLAPVAIATYLENTAVITKGKSTDVALDGSQSTDPDGTIISWSWKDSSGTVIGTSSSISVRLKEGQHGFVLTVEDNEGAIASADLSVIVKTAADDGVGNKGKPPKN